MLTVELSLQEAELLIKLVHNQRRILDKKAQPVLSTFTAYPSRSDKKYVEYHVAAGAEASLELARCSWYYTSGGEVLWPYLGDLKERRSMERQHVIAGGIRGAKAWTAEDEEAYGVLVQQQATIPKATRYRSLPEEIKRTSEASSSKSCKNDASLALEA